MVFKLSTSFIVSFPQLLHLIAFFTDAIRCSNCGKETMKDVDNLKTIYQDTITTFLLNTMLHHVGMLWIIENNK